jgi:predicted cupin superfamily sugar epimerase
MDATPVVHRLGMNLAAGERPQLVVPANCWQTAASLGAWTLVGCTVAPGFRVFKLRDGAARLAALALMTVRRSSQKAKGDQHCPE